MIVSTPHKKNVLYNLIGQILPIVVGIVTIPIIIKYLGTERFGILTIAWMIIGYFSLFDMGLGRALTQAVAEKIGNKKTEEIPVIFWTCLSFMAVVSVVGSIIIILCANQLVTRVFKISASLEGEALLVFIVLGLSIPFVVLASALIGFLSAYHRFDIVNAIKVPMGTMMLLSPLIALPFTHNLAIIVALMTALRIVFCIIYFYSCIKVNPLLVQRISADRSSIRPLLRFGGWMTVSNIVGPVMVYFDRFLIGSYLSVTSVAYYSTPFEVITKLWIVPNAVNGVTFPLYAANYMHSKSKEEITRIYNQSLLWIFYLLYPAILCAVVFAYAGMELWVGTEFAIHSYRVLQWLSIGVFLNCLAQIPYTLIQGTNNPEITGKLHLVELVFYIPVLLYLIQRNGIEGAALAWLLRSSVDALLLFVISMRKKLIINTGSGKKLVMIGLSVFPLIYLTLLPDNFFRRCIASVVCMLFALSLFYLKPLKKLPLYKFR